MLQGDPVGLLVDLEEKLAGLDDVVLRDGDLDDAAGHVGADRDLVRLDVGILRFDEAAAGDVEVGADDRQDQRPENNQDRSEEHTSALQSLMRITYHVLCLNKQK